MVNTRQPDPGKVAEAARMFHEGVAIAEIARRLGTPRPTVQSWKDAGRLVLVHERQADFIPPVLVDYDPPVEELIDRAEKDFIRRHAARESREWMRFKLKDDKPFGLAFVGDPHVDDGGTNWPLLKRHHTIMKETPGIYAIGLGDFTNGWSGRLAALHKDQSITARQAYKLAEWLFGSLPWMLLVKGNHDMWASQHGPGDPLDFIRRGPVPLEDWFARFVVETPSSEFKVHVRHDFKGHSQWNDLHSLMKSAKTGDEADILAAGHRHIWGTARGEHNGRVYTLIRARGYKWIDDYAERHQFESQKEGATVLAICDPRRQGTGRVMVFEDLEHGAEVLTMLRRG